MDVILLEDLKGLGDKGAMVHVKPGYARNYLLPRRLAIQAGNKAANLYQELLRQSEVRDQKRVLEAKAEAAKIDGVEVNISAQANDEDTLFGSITASDVADAIQAQRGIEVDRRRVGLDEPVKELSELDVTVKLHTGVEATLTVVVVAA